MNQRNRIVMTATASLFAALLLGGCGSGNKEGLTQSGSALFGGVATVGDSVCAQCHSATNDPVNGKPIIAEYQLNSPHNQDGLGCESCHGGGAGHNGVGPIPYPLSGGPDEVAARCATCHNGSTTITVGGVATTAPITNAATDFKTSVHASGTAGTGPSNNRNTAPCFRCHTNEGAILSDSYGFTGPLGDASIIYTDGTNTAGNITGVLDDPSYRAAVPLSGTYNAITCDTCHAHGGGMRPVTTRDGLGNIVTWNPNPGNTSNANDQFNLCTSCHNAVANDKATVMASGDVIWSTNAFTSAATSGTQTAPTGHHEDDWYRVIATTHLDNPDNTVYGITGYVLRTKPTTALDATTGTYVTRPATTCFDCHGHEARTNTGNLGRDASIYTSARQAYTPSGTIFYNSSSATIYTDWAQSAHAGFQLSQKLTAVQGQSGTAAVDAAINANSQENPFGGSGAGSHDFSGASSQACQRCHTSTGASNFMNSPANYDQTKNDFSNLAGWSSRSTTTMASKQREVVYCWACHNNAANGVLRTPGAIPAVYTYSGSTVVFPNVSDSNVCVTCHSGRGNNDAVTSAVAGAYASKVTYGSVAHHLPAAATVFSAVSHVGYEFPGQSYANLSYFQHDKIGTPAAEANTGTHGPCAACHMGDSRFYGKAGHSFEAVTYTDSTATTIASIVNPALCANCHSGIHAMTVEELQANKDESANAVQLLTDILKQANGQVNYAAADMTSTTFLNGATAKISDLGAVNNSKYLGDEPGAYVHNRGYFRKLIFDSIDWAQHGSITGSITVPLSYTGAVTWFSADATTGVATRH